MRPSRPRVIAQPAAGEFRNWAFPAVVADGVAPAAAEPPPRAEDLAALREEARRAGHAEGHAQGHSAGHAEGLRAGRADAAEQLGAERARLQALVAALAEPLRALDAAVEADIIALALAAGGALARRELQHDPSALAAIVHEAVALLPGAARAARVRVHPDDLELLAGDEALAAMLVADATVTPGGCHVDSDLASVDAGMTARRQALIDALAELPDDRATPTDVDPEPNP